MAKAKAPAKVYGPQTLGVWAADILANIGAPHTRNNVNNIAAWYACETGQGSYNSLHYNNIFNTEQESAYGSGFVPTTQVPTFSNYNTGLWATLMTLRQANMAPIVRALRADAPRPEFAAAVGQAGWGTNPSCISSSTESAGLVAGTGLRPAGPASGYGKGSGQFAATTSAAGAGSGCVAGLIAMPVLIPLALIRRHRG